MQLLQRWQRRLRHRR